LSTDISADYRFGKPFNIERPGEQNVALVITQNCNLACRYCYLTHKNDSHTMTFETAKRAIDFFLKKYSMQEALYLDFAGGEPLLEIDLIHEIADYFEFEVRRLNHKWKDRYLFHIPTNGILYDDHRVQEFIRKHWGHVGVSITIDGTKEKHDMNRVFPNGRGSYDAIIDNVKLWIEQFGDRATTKVTFSSADLPLLKESIIHLWNLGLKNVPANVVHEDVWKEGDDEVLEDQLKALADYVLENELWNEVNCMFFSERVGYPYTQEFLRSNQCGAGVMIAVDAQGLCYPCVRFLGFSLDHQRPYIIGDINSGISFDKIRPFISCTIEAQSDTQCRDCEVATECSSCHGNDYDSSVTGSLFKRATFVCRMHKARVRANEYYWARLANKTGIRRPAWITSLRRRHLYFILADDSVAHCAYGTRQQGNKRMSRDLLEHGLDWAARNFYRPILLQPATGPRVAVSDHYDVIHVCDAQRADILPTDIPVFENEVSECKASDNCILVLDKTHLNELVELTTLLLHKSNRVNLILRSIGGFTMEDIGQYEDQLHSLARHMVASSSDIGSIPEVNVLTDRLYLSQHRDCGAGVHNMALAPDGYLYACPAFYHHGLQDGVLGALDGDLNPELLSLCNADRAPICKRCEALQCKRCLFDNLGYTLQINIPSRAQCLSALAELRVSAWLREQLLASRLVAEEELQAFRVPFVDPYETSVARTLREER